MMNNNRKESIHNAIQLAQKYFNEQPEEIRKLLSSPNERLSEINLALYQGDKLNIAWLKQRKMELENWLIEWYKKQINNDTTTD